MLLRLSILFISFLGSFSLVGQSMSYTLFKGKVYKYPNARKYIEWEEDYQDKYPLINEIAWDSIHVPQRETEMGFPDVDRDGAFGIMFNTVLTVEETAMYRFAITSDDGSIIWVNDEKIIDNDFSNGMHIKADTIALRAGTHSVRIWYFQAYPTMFGVIFESEVVPDMDLKFEMDTIAMNQDFLFDTGQFYIKGNSNVLLDSISNILNKYDSASVKILGHTDNVGDENYNLELSQNRANAIRDYLLEKVSHPGVKFSTRGMGESIPIANNNTEEGRAANRRVELLIEGY